MNRIPTQGRIVRFNCDGGETYPAVIVRTFDVADGSPPLCNLHVLIDGNNARSSRVAGGDVFSQAECEANLAVRYSVPFYPEPKPGHWSWPPRV